MFYIDVVPLKPFSSKLTYIFDESLELGTKVKIPVSNTKCHGFVIKTNKETKDNFKYKKISSFLKDTYFNDKNFDFYSWLSKYYHYPLGELFSLVFPSYVPKRNIDFEKYKATFISKIGPIHSLNKDQTDAISKIKKNQDNFLLHGVTGSGKTEVYIEVAKEFIKKGKSVLIMVPEISLTPQLVDRISKHFGGEISVIHSGLTKRQKYINWMNIKKGISKLCIGARSAIFAPFKDLGLIIVDEEQDSSFKQDDRIRYNARDLSFVLAKIFDAKLILSTATPSTDIYYKAKKGNLSYVTLKNRVKDLKLPSTKILDLRKEKLISKNISKNLYEDIKKELLDKNQVILYINRRGYSHSILCKTCGANFLCPNCFIPLRVYKNKKSLICNYCNFISNIPSFCYKCNSDDISLVGSGTEKIVEEVESLFSEAKILRMDSDEINSKDKLKNALDKINKKQVDIIVGTQILSKGHDFPDVSMVGIINIDGELQIPDFRSSERTFQQIMQVSGRAGRRRKGKVIVQTYMPEHYAVNFAIENNYDGFYKKEFEIRKEANYPPFVSITDLKFSSLEKITLEKEINKAKKLLEEIVEKLKHDVLIFGPLASPIPIINKRYRSHILIKSKSKAKLNKLIDIFYKNFKLNKKIRLSTDVDPYSLF
jgi:primosomal protein N' (replication factor Y) (superfamily II helicase)